MANQHTGAWSEEEIEQLRRLAEEGLLLREIGARLGRSASSVHGKLQQLGIGLRDAAGERAQTRLERIAKRRIAARKGTFGALGLPKVKDSGGQAGQPALAAKETKPTRSAVAFLDRRLGQCCWPLWGAEMPAHPGERFVCGAAAARVPGPHGLTVQHSYCPAHRDRAQSAASRAEREAA